MKKFVLGLLIFCSLSVSAFKKPDANVVGTYGVSSVDPSKIELKLNDDHTFSYQDFSDPAKKIDVKGNWEELHGTVVLTGYVSPYRFHTKWKISTDGSKANARKGATFYSLARK